MAIPKPRLISEELWYFIKIILVYACWKVVHAILWWTPESKLAWQLHLLAYESFYASLVSSILNTFFGYHSSIAEGKVILLDTVHTDYNHLIWIAEHCLAIPAMVVFSFSILIYKGAIKDKAWFIPLGLFFIFCINLLRLVSLAILKYNLPETRFQFYHRYVFVALTYGAILGLVIWWMERTTKVEKATT